MFQLGTIRLSVCMNKIRASAAIVETFKYTYVSHNEQGQFETEEM